MSRKIVVYLAVALVVNLAQPTHAQRSGKVHRIGVLSAVGAASFSDNADALRQGLRDLGYVEGKNLTIEYRYADGKIDRLTELATDPVRLKADVIVASSSPAVSASRDATKDIPIVFSVTGDPVATGLVASLARQAVI